MKTLFIEINHSLPTGSGPVKIAKDLEEAQGGRKAKRPRASTMSAKKEPLS